MLSWVGAPRPLLPSERGDTLGAVAPSLGGATAIHRADDRYQYQQRPDDSLTQLPVLH